MSHADASADSLDRPAPGAPTRLAPLLRRPLMLACVALIVGIVTAQVLPPGISAWAVLCIVGLLAAVVTARVSPAVSWLGVMVGCLAVGGLRYAAVTRPLPNDIAGLAGMRDAAIEGTVSSEPEERSWSRAFRLRVTEVRGADGVVREARGTVEVRAPRDAQVNLGDRVRLEEASIKLPPAAEQPGEFDYRGWLARQGVTALVTARSASALSEDRGWRLALTRAGLTLRRRVVGSILAAMPGRDGALYARLLVGMVYGLGASRVPEEIVEQFRRAGTVHLLVVSGAQVSMIAVAILGLTGARRLHMLRPWQAALALGGVLVLVLIVGLEASVTRALAMFALVLLAGLTRRDYDVYTAIALSAAVICAVDPRALSSLSFQLTFAATLGVVLFLPREPLRRVDGSPAAQPLPLVRGIAWGTLGAWVMTTPLLAHSFAGFAVAGNLANVVNVPLSVLVMLLGFVALPVSLAPVLTPLLVALCAAARALLAMVMHVNVLAAALPVAFAHGVHMSVAGCVAWYIAVATIAALGLMGLAQRSLDRALLRLHPMWPGVAVVGFAAMLVATQAAVGAPPRGMEVTVLPVGAGQCVIVRTPSGATLMADCGGGGGAPGGGDEVAEGTVLPFLTRMGIERIDVLAISHWDSDHFNALPRVLARTRVGMLVLPPTLPDARPPAWLKQIRAERVVAAQAGGAILLDGGVRVDVLAPRQPWLEGTRDDANDNSVVLRVSHGSVHVLLPGDLDAEGVARLLHDARAIGRSLGAQVLVLPHHGRRVERTAELLDAAAPAWAIASCDWQADRYLDADARARIAQCGARLLRTDEDGSITVTTDGSTVHVRTSHGELATASALAAARA